MSLADGLRLEGDLANLLTNTKDRLEGAAAFKEKRKPRYRRVGVDMGGAGVIYRREGASHG
jgi:1,4-dihydroxy-2-naphthoyl-CoA synthase